MPVDMIDAHGTQVSILTVAMPDGSKAPAHVLVPLGADFSSNTDPVVVPGAAIRSVVANPARSGGFVQAGAANAGKITVTMPRPAGGNPLVTVLQAGDTFRLSIFPGRVLQQAFTVTGDTIGDTATTVEYL